MKNGNNLQKNSKGVFFKEYNKHWSNNRNQCQRLVAWELHMLDLTPDTYKEIICTDLLNNINYRDLVLTEKFLDE